MDRRDFMRIGLAGGVAGAVLPQRLLADEDDSPSMAGGVYHTKEYPGRWAKKVSSHSPKLEKTTGPDGQVMVKVVTDHPQQGYKHYIVKHLLLDAKYRFMAEKMFDPEKEDPISQFPLPAGYKGRVYALSMCNKHDLWLNGMEI
jgi:superoxide reductase